MSPHASHTPCVALESYFECYTRVGHGVMHVSQTLRAAHESDLVCCMRVRIHVLHASHCT